MDAKVESSSREMSAAAANWSKLGDVLDLIIHKLDLVDFLHFSATCRSWHSCAQTHRKFCRVCPKTLNPWVLFAAPFNLNDKEIKNHDFNLYDIANQKSYNISIPISVYAILGSSNGFIVIADVVYDLHVINPLTGSHYPLPPTSSVTVTLEPYNCFDKAVIKVCPYSHKPLFVLGILYDALLFVKVGDISWTQLNYGFDFENDGNFNGDYYDVDDAVFWKGKLHAVGKRGTYVFDLDRLLDSPTYLAGEYHCNGWNCLVESPNGDDLFLVVRDTKYDKLRDAEGRERWVTKGFIIFKFDEDRGRWYNIKDIGDLALFVGTEGGNCLFINATSRSPNVVAKNNICFSNEYDTGGVGVLDLNDGSIRRLNVPIDLRQYNEWNALWFIPLCN